MQYVDKEPYIRMSQAASTASCDARMGAISKPVSNPMTILQVPQHYDQQCLNMELMCFGGQQAFKVLKYLF